MRLSIRALLLLFIPLLITCTSSRQTVLVHNLPNYDPNATHQLIFMDFTIRRNGLQKPEQVILTNSIIGNGEMKNIGEMVHTPYQLKLLRYTNDNQPPKETILEHPLFRSIEIANTDGTFSRTLTSDQAGNFSVRFPYTSTLTKLELYSVTPDQGSRKIHTLQLKP